MLRLVHIDSFSCLEIQGLRHRIIRKIAFCSSASLRHASFPDMGELLPP